MSSTSIADEGYDDLEDDGGLSGFWILSIFLIVLCVFSAIVYFAYQRGLSDSDSLPVVNPNPTAVREQVDVVETDTTRDQVMDVLNQTDTPEIIANVDPDADPLDGYQGSGMETSTPTDLPAVETTDPMTSDPVATDTGNTPPVPSIADRDPATSVETSTPTTSTPTPVAGAAGSWAVQVGAFGSNDEAMNNYTRFSSRFGTLVSAQTPEVNVATVNGVTYHRLWLGEFSGREAAQTHCNSLKAAGLDCLARRR